MSRDTSTPHDAATGTSGVDENLVARIARGDGKAEEALIKRYSRPVQLLLEKRLRSTEQAADLLQETFLVVIARLRDHGVDDPARLAGFIRQTALNLAISAQRKFLRQRTDTEDDSLMEAIVDSVAGPAELIEEQDLVRLTRQALRELPMERDRDLLWRYLVLGENKEACMATYQLTSEHFDRVLHRALARLRILLNERLTDGSDTGTGGGLR
jgi:RNA polymerase sigma factor (sigma-70 family)